MKTRVGGAMGRHAAVRVAVGAVLISFSPVFVVVADIAPASAAFYRLLIGGAVLLAYAQFRGLLRPVNPVSLLLASICGVLVALDLSCWHLSIGLIGPGLATVLGNHQVFVVAFVGVLFLGEKLTLRLGMSILLAVVGIFLIFGLDWGEMDSRFKLGVLFGGFTAVLYASFLLVLRRAQSLPGAPDSVVTVAALSVVGAGVLAFYVWIGDESYMVPDLGTWGALVSYAIVCHVIGWVLISTGLPHLQVSRAALLLLLQPALSFVWDVVLFGRPTKAVEVIGASLALCAIYLGAASQDAERRR